MGGEQLGEMSDFTKRKTFHTLSGVGQKDMFTEIFTAQSSSEAEIVIALLRANGIHPSDLEMSPRIGFAGADLWYHVRVPLEEVESAKEVLNSKGDDVRGDADSDDSASQRQSWATWQIILLILIAVGFLVGIIGR